jgi:CRP-like cAMP-binding protein
MTFTHEGRAPLGRAELCRVLDVDPDLAKGLRPRDLAEARAAVLAAVEDVPPGTWSPEERLRRSLAALVQDGLLLHYGAVGRSVVTELLGPGDLILPVGHDPVGLLPVESEWVAAEGTTIMWLGRRFERAARRWPSLSRALLSRAQERIQRATTLQAIAQLRRVDERLIALLWHLADRWGRVNELGVVVPLELRHAVLARLVGACRPSVTTALTQLTAQGVIVRQPDTGWILLGDPRDPLANTPARVAELWASVPDPVSSLTTVDARRLGRRSPGDRDRGLRDRHVDALTRVTNGPARGGDGRVPPSR